MGVKQSSVWKINRLDQKPIESDLFNESLHNFSNISLENLDDDSEEEVKTPKERSQKGP